MDEEYRNMDIHPARLPDVAVWIAASSFFQVTVSPGFTGASAGT
jgi:hypothetical protein